MNKASLANLKTRHLLYFNDFENDIKYTFHNKEGCGVVQPAGIVLKYQSCTLFNLFKTLLLHM